MSETDRRAALGPDALPHDVIRDLLPTFVSTRADIDLVEQANLESAFRWAFGRRRVATPEKLLTVEFSDRLHRKMFEDVWRWAGRHCTTRTAGGVTADRVTPRLEKLFAELRNAHERGSDHPPDRARNIRDGLHAISPYQDGNTRHSQLMADLYLHLLGEPPLAADDLPAPSRLGSTNAALKARRDELTALRLALDAVAAEGPKNLEAALNRATKRTKK